MKYIKITIGMFCFTLGITMWMWDINSTGWEWWIYVSWYINMLGSTSLGLYLLDNKE